MGLRSRLCYWLSLPALKEPVAATMADRTDYQQWRMQSLRNSWTRFDNALVDGKRVLDFGCGTGQLSLHLAATCKPATVTGVDVDLEALELAREGHARGDHAALAPCEFVAGDTEGLPFEDASFDTILAFDCFEHVMQPAAILADFSRVLARGGMVAIEWFPFRGPWGPHMESLIPIPWAHLLFGQRAMFAAAADIYEHPRFKSRHWDVDERGHKRPNKWRQWASFREQGYVNELRVPEFQRMAHAAGFEISRMDLFGIGGQTGLVAAFGRALIKLPWLGEWLTSYCLIELRKK